MSEHKTLGPCENCGVTFDTDFDSRAWCDACEKADNIKEVKEKIESILHVWQLSKTELIEIINSIGKAK